VVSVLSSRFVRFGDDASMFARLSLRLTHHTEHIEYNLAMGVFVFLRHAKCTNVIVIVLFVMTNPIPIGSSLWATGSIILMLDDYNASFIQYNQVNIGTMLYITFNVYGTANPPMLRFIFDMYGFTDQVLSSNVAFVTIGSQC
jgi:hypothetical protein